MWLFITFIWPWPYLGCCCTRLVVAIELNKEKKRKKTHIVDKVNKSWQDFVPFTIIKYRWLNLNVEFGNESSLKLNKIDDTWFTCVCMYLCCWIMWYNIIRENESWSFETIARVFLILILISLYKSKIKIEWTTLEISNFFIYRKR